MARIDDIQSARRGSEAGRRTPSLVLVGLSHHTADFEVLERATFDETAVVRALRLLASTEPVREAAIVSTCNRTEIYLVSEEHEKAAGLARELLGEASLPDSAAVYVKFGRDVAAHLFRVAAGIDSLMVGEVQILGQVKQALAQAEQAETTGTVLGKLFARSLRTGKRARAETEIGQGAVSVSYAALGLARKIFADLSGRSLLVVGAGETGALAARHFAETDLGELRIANRTRERAELLAREVGGQVVAWDELPEALKQADIVVTATSAPAPIIDHDMVKRAARRRGSRRLVLIDIAMPRDVDPAVHDLEGVFLYDMSALDVIVQRNLFKRRREIPAVEAIVAEEVETYLTWQASLQAGPTIQDLRRLFDEVRETELAALKGKLGDEDLQRVERAMRGMVNKLLHQPQSRLRRPPPGTGGAEGLVAAARLLFGLDGDDDADRSDDTPERGGGGKRR
jgi:glutamyl-tRNA reductase